MSPVTPRKVLLIDNAKMIHSLVRVHLASERIELHSAYDGIVGERMARELRPDLILLDIEMPAPDGWQVCRNLKADPATAGCPIIFLSGETDTLKKIRGLELGAVDYVTKPCDPAELKARARSALRTKELIDLLAAQAMIDALTGMRNRRYFDARLVAEVGAARRHGTPLACVVADVDHFKKFNDRHGHAVGDEVLRRTAGVLRDAARAEDVVCRFGGEEFAMLLPRTDRAAGAACAERARRALEAAGVTHQGARLGVTASFGVAELSGIGRAEGPEKLVERADAALYAAKGAGRNRVCTDADVVAAAARGAA